MNRLPVRFPPTDQHSWPGYLLLLLQKNGLRDYKRLFALLDINIVPPKDARNWSDELLGVLIPRLANALEVKQEILWILAERHHDRAWLDVLPEIGDIRIATPRICLQCCIDQSGTFDWRWQFPVFSRCAEHGSELHSHCPQCRKPFTWRGEVLTQCPSCKVKWSEIKHPCLERGINELKLWHAFERNEPTVQTLMHDVARAMLALARPFDTLNQRMQVWPSVADQNNLTSDAYSLLSDPGLIVEWKRACIKYRSELMLLGDDAIYAPVIQWENQPHSPEFESLNHEQLTPLTEYTEFLKPSRLKLIAEQNFSEARYHVDRAGLATLVKLRTDDLLPLVTKNLLSPVKNTPIFRDQLFDARQLISLLDVTVNTPPDMTYVTRGASKELRRHLASYGDLLASLVAQEIRGGVKEIENWQIVVVNESDYQQWLKQHFRSQCHEQQSITNVASALGVSSKKAINLVQEGFLQWARWQHGRELIDGESLWQFWCKQNGYS